LTKIGLLSDTHHYLDDKVFKHFEDCNEIWHAGDFGTIELANKLSAFRPLRGVYGNIDGQDIRSVYKESLSWKCEEINVFMQHIGGYPGKYVPAVREQLQNHPTQLFISGHSHILKIMYDEKYKCLHMNPGAAGKQGWHTKRTLVKFSIDKDKIFDCSVIELANR
jgi:putative phosphoesterase